MRMEWVGNVIKQIIITALALLFVMNSALCEQGTWDCPECGRTGNTGNYCGKCRHPAPWIENSQDNISKGSIEIGDIIRFGHYEQDNNLSNGLEEIEWIVLDISDDGGKALLLSRFGLDVYPYNDTLKEVNWETCSLRDWLNSEFLKSSFTAEEQTAILITEVDNSTKQGYWNTNGGKNTSDRIFLLSYYEAKKYLEVTWENDKNIHARVAPTAYASTRGARVRNSYKTSENTAAAWWWLRSPGLNRSIAANVSYDGSLKYCNVDNSYDKTDRAVDRPAMWLNLESVVFQTGSMIDKQ